MFLLFFLLTPAGKVKDFREEFASERVIAVRHRLWGSPRWYSYVHRLRLFLRRKRIIGHRLGRAIFRFETKWFKPTPKLVDLFRQYLPSLVISTLPHFTEEYDVVTWRQERVL